MTRSVQRTNTYTVRHVVDLYESSRIQIDRSDTCLPFKADVIQYVSENGKLPSVGPFGNKIIEYFEEIGADRDLPQNEMQRKGYIMRFHHHLCLLNDRFPGDLPYPFVYKCFFYAIVHNKVQLKGFNIREHIRVFHIWWNENHNRVYELYYRKHPERAPKQIEQKSSRTIEQQIRSLERTIATMEQIGINEDAIEKERNRLRSLKEQSDNRYEGGRTPKD